jgi:hypothetical protein
MRGRISLKGSFRRCGGKSSSHPTGEPKHSTPRAASNSKGQKFANYYHFAPCGDHLVLASIAENAQ